MFASIVLLLTPSPSADDGFEGDPMDVVHMFAEETTVTNFSHQEHVYRVSAIIDGGRYPLSEVSFLATDRNDDPFDGPEVEYEDADDDGLLSSGDRIYLHNVSSYYDGGLLRVFHKGAIKGSVRIVIEPFESPYRFVLEQQAVCKTTAYMWETSFKVVWAEHIIMFPGYPIDNIIFWVNDADGDAFPDVNITLEDSNNLGILDVGDTVIIENLTARYNGGSLIVYYGFELILTVGTIHF
jgi:hypothetical protein